MRGVDGGFQSFSGLGADAVEYRLQALETFDEIILHTKTVCRNGTAWPIRGMVMVALASVMVVDDEFTQRELLRHWLEKWGYPFRLVDGASVALEEMLADPADILLVDIKMPERDGFWLIERVRPKWPRAAIIMVSGMLELDVVERARRMGAMDFVSKPFGRELLRQALDRAERSLTAADQN